MNEDLLPIVSDKHLKNQSIECPCLIIIQKSKFHSCFQVALLFIAVSYTSKIAMKLYQDYNSNKVTTATTYKVSESN